MTAKANIDAGADGESKLSAEIVVGGAYRIMPDSPQRELDRPGAPAFAVRDRRNPTRQLFANVCEPNVLPRIETLVQLKTLREAAVIRPVAWDPVSWPPAGQRCFAVVYEHPEAAPIMRSLDDRMPAMSTEFLVESMLGPLSQTLALIARRGQSHRAISPDNMYRVGDAGDTVILGDCVTSPPGWSEPVLMLPIEHGMTPREGRGAGGFGDDIYALGASMLFLALGWCPVANRRDEDIVEAKVRQGSFMALLNGERPPVGLREPLRGMLSDDPRERWTLDDIDQWIGGVMRRSIQPSRDFRSDRPFEFDGVEHRNCRSLAHAFGANPTEAAKAVRSKDFDNWLVRGVSDPALVERVTQILMYPGHEAADDVVVARICGALDPMGPLRFRGMAATAEGLGTTLADAMIRGDRELVQLIHDCIAKGLPNEWLKHRSMWISADIGDLDRELRRLQQLIKHSGPGYGMERALYEMNPFIPCCSEILKHEYIYSLRDLLPALEKVVHDTGDLPGLVDRHIAAFIAARLKGPTERILTSIDDTRSNSLASKLGMVQLLGQVQEDYGPESLPNLCDWLSEELAPAIDQFQSKTTREDMKRKLAGVVARGRLSGLHDHLNSRKRIKQDQIAKRQAAREFAAAAVKIEQLASKEFQQDALRTGWSIAAAGSMIISIATIAILVVW